MARDKGQIYEASDWFKEALQINQVLCLCVCKNTLLRQTVKYLNNSCHC